ncbi:TauD/TfdA family dioxygenase [Flavobacterium procerum]|uniref:TauD/TfdA family dioxygenase n=1 Tax=Flavobacterium procerum TaxID=1455569 RepID=A0ABV6BS85_9FLAO
METSDLLTSCDFEKDFNLQKIIETLRKGQTIVLIKNFPLSDYEFQSFINSIGDSIKENRNNCRQDVFDVKISKQNNFFTSIATSSLAFPLHTDCADFDIIPNCVGLLCVEPAIKEQGANNFIFLNKIISQLSEDAIDDLLNKKWKFRNQYRSILSGNNERYQICYDRITMESFSKISEKEIEVLNNLDKIFAANSFKIKLEKQDLVLFRNDLLLHGRDAIDVNSNRLIKRIRFNVN